MSSTDPEASGPEASGPEATSPEATGAQPGRLVLDEPVAGVARLTIENRDKRGALDRPILDAFVELIPTLDQRCLIITGQGRTFSAGYDLMSAATDLFAAPEEVFAERAEALIAHPFTAALEAVAAFPFPTIACLNGHAIGGGLELAVCCDLRIAAAEVKLGMPPAQLGLIYSHTGIAKFIETIGVPRTRELFLTARRINAATASAWGLINTVVPFETLAQETVDLAGEIVSLAPLAQRGNKQIIDTVSAGAGELDPTLAAELVALRRACFSSADFREGVSAFAEKRAPVWRGE